MSVTYQDPKDMNDVISFKKGISKNVANFLSPASGEPPQQSYRWYSPSDYPEEYRLGVSSTATETDIKRTHRIKLNSQNF